MATKRLFLSCIVSIALTGAGTALWGQTGGFAYVANVNSFNVSSYTINATTGALVPVAGSPFPAGTNPASVTKNTTSAVSDDDVDNDDLLDIVQRSQRATGIVLGIISAPTVANGIIGGEPTEFNVLLDAPGVPPGDTSDALNFGHQIPSGGRLEMFLGGTFERNGVDNSKAFRAIGSNMFMVMTIGHPQNPISAASGSFVNQANYSILDDSNHTITIAPNDGSGPNGLANERANQVGVKVLHLRPAEGTSTQAYPFTNGAAGTIGTVTVTIFDADNNVVETGSAQVTFRASVGRQIFITNTGLVTRAPTVNPEVVEGTNFQHVAPDAVLTNTVRAGGDDQPFSASAPYAPRFFIFEDMSLQPRSFVPFLGIPNVGVVPADTGRGGRRSHALIVQDADGDGMLDPNVDTVIGRATLVGPKRSRPRILATTELTTSGDGVGTPTGPLLDGVPLLVGPNGSILSVPVQVGDVPGKYVLRVRLDGGNAAMNTIVVDP